MKIRRLETCLLRLIGLSVRYKAKVYPCFPSILSVYHGNKFWKIGENIMWDIQFFQS